MTSLSCQRVRVLLERLLDGELASESEARVRTHLRACGACRAEFAAAQSVQAGLRALPRYRCPESVTAAVWARVAGEAALQTNRDGAWRARCRAAWQILWRPAVAGVGVAATALCIALLGRAPERPAVPAADLVRAEAEVRWAFAYVAQVTRRASDAAMEATVGEIVGDVIGERVVAPVTKAVRRPLEEDRTP